jgi:ubiquinone/menaquinone biosynthesis C-methylase UbiE
MSVPPATPAEIYEREMVPAIFARWAPDMIELAQIRAGQRVLDVACGTGVVTRLLADRVGPGGHVVGLDLSPVMLAAARAGVRNANIEWREASAQSIPLPDSAFDAVVCQQGLQFFPDKATALAEMRRVLVPGGQLALAVWRSIEHAPAFQALEQALTRRIGAAKGALPPFGFGDAEAIRALVVGAGFREVRLRADVKMTRFASAEHMVRSVASGAPSMLGALAEQGDAALDSIVVEVGEATRMYVDDEGLAFPQATHFITALR